MSDLEKLSELLKQAKYCSDEEMARYLVSAGLVMAVKCKNCKHRYLNKHGEPCCEVWSHGNDTVIRDYDFCSYGERKANV